MLSAKAKAAATKALALDDSLGEAHASLACALDLYGWDWETAETEYKLAIKPKSRLRDRSSLVRLAFDLDGAE